MAVRTRLEAAADLLRQGRLAEARTRLLKELRVDPRSAVAMELLGVVASEMGKHEEAIGHLRRAAQLMPSSPGPRLNLGKALLEAGALDEAADVLQEAVGRWPQIAAGHMSYGNVLLLQGKPDLAAEAYRAAIRLAPAWEDPYVNLAALFYNLRDHAEVCRIAELLLAVNPRSPQGAFYLAMGRQELCDWREHEPRLQKVADFVRQGLVVRGMAFAGLLLWDDAELHRRCAELTSPLVAHPARISPSRRPPARKDRRIRVAYVSADYRRHPTSSLIARLFEGHDRDRFEVVGISLGRDDGSAERERMAKASTGSWTCTPAPQTLSSGPCARRSSTLRSISWATSPTASPRSSSSVWRPCR